MPRKQRGVGCFGSRSNHPEIRYGIDPPRGMQFLQDFSQPMPEEGELNSKFAEIVVSEDCGVFVSILADFRSKYIQLY